MLLRFYQENVEDISLKLKMYKTLIRPVLTYGSETGTLKQKDQEHLRTFEQKLLRKIFEQ